MTFERFNTGSQLFRTAPWLTLAATYVLLATNVDFAAELSWHDSQRLAHIVFLALVSVGVFVSASARPTLEIWTLLPRWIRFAVGVALTLGLASGFLAMYPRWAWLEWSHLVLVGILTIAVAAECRSPNAARDQSLILVFYAVALISTVKAVTVYFSMLIAGPDYGMAFTVEDLFTGVSNIRFFGHVQTNGVAGVAVDGACSVVDADDCFRHPRQLGGAADWCCSRSCLWWKNRRAMVALANRRADWRRR
jgi:hypothetical protein